MWYNCVIIIIIAIIIIIIIMHFYRAIFSHKSSNSNARTHINNN